MKIVKLSVKGFEGLEELNLEPGDGLNLITGENGTGKTSVLEAIRVAFSNRGLRTRLVRDTEDEGLILFELDNGVNGSRVVDAKGRTGGPVILHKQDKPVSKAQSFLDSLGFGLSFNPVEFVAQRDVEQTKLLLNVIPVSVPLPILLKLSGNQRLPNIDYTEHPLAVLEQIRLHHYEQRRDLRKQAREVEATAKTLLEKVPADFDVTSVDGSGIWEIHEKLQEYQGFKHQLRQGEEAKGRLEAEIKAAEERLARLRNECVVAENNILEAISCLGGYNNDYEEHLQAQIKEYGENQKTLSLFNRAKDEEARAAEIRAQAEDIHALLTQVEQKPGELLERSDFPVKGIKIQDGIVTVNGLPISQLSTGEQLKIAVEIAIATMGELKVILVDGLETLDPDNQQMLFTRLSEAGVQAFITKVDKGELKIVVVDNEEQTPYPEPIYQEPDEEYELPF